MLTHVDQLSPTGFKWAEAGKSNPFLVFSSAQTARWGKLWINLMSERWGGKLQFETESKCPPVQPDLSSLALFPIDFCVKLGVHVEGMQAI